MKITFIIINLLAAVVIYLWGTLIVAVHRTHTFSIYMEMRGRGLIDIEKENELKYSVNDRISNAGQVEVHIYTFTTAIAILLMANAIVIGIFFKPKEDPIHESASDA